MLWYEYAYVIATMLTIFLFIMTVTDCDGKSR